MTKQFILLKKYPGSMLVGTIITFSSYDAEGYCYGWDDSGQVRKEDVKESPEFWEEVVTPKTELTYTKMVSEEEFVELRKKVEQLQQDVILIKSKLTAIVLTPPPAPIYPPNQPWNPYPNNPLYPEHPYNSDLYCKTTATNKTEINE